MTDEMNPEDRAVAFLKHLACNKRKGEDFESTLLATIVKCAKLEDFDLEPDAIKKFVRVKFKIREFSVKWPWPRP